MSKLYHTIIALVCLCLLACDDSKWKPFEIENCKEVIEETFPDGRHKRSQYFDESSGDMVAEVEFHPNGQPKIHKRYEHNTLHGESWCYYEDGKTWSLNNYKEGLWHGVYKTWYSNGQLHQLGNYANGKKTGEWITYYPNGAVDTQGYYLDDEKAGVWTSFNQQGVKLREQNYVEDTADTLSTKK
jgi:antitoxin component YwqK of YwqJK toxin-antitoxin module